MKNKIKGSVGNGEYGWYAYVEDSIIEIWHEAGREGGRVYRGEYMGDNMPYMSSIKKENVKLYNNIIKYFTENNNTSVRNKNDIKDAILVSSKTDIQKLREVFEIDKDEIRNSNVQLYYAILGVLDTTR